VTKSKSLGHNIGYNIAGFGQPFLVTLVTVPPLFQGDWLRPFRGSIPHLAVVRLFGYFNLFDFGLSRATANRLARLRNGSSRDRSAVFYTAIAANAFLGHACGCSLLRGSAAPCSPIYWGALQNWRVRFVTRCPLMAAMFPLAMTGGCFCRLPGDGGAFPNHQHISVLTLHTVTNWIA
jgi:hypothetical protein